MGENDLTTTTDGQHLDVLVDRYEGHENFDETKMKDDIAIVFLERDVNWNGRFRREIHSLGHSKYYCSKFSDLYSLNF